MQRFHKARLVQMGWIGLAVGAIATGLGMGRSESLSQRPFSEPSYPVAVLATVGAVPSPSELSDRMTMVYRARPVYAFASLGSERLDEQLAQYTEYLQTYGRPDVLVVGSSRSLQGVDPQVLQVAIAQQREVSVYNFSINGATAQVVDVVVRQVLTLEQLPDVIIWAMGSRAFNSGRPDVTYAQIIESDGYAQLLQGSHPIHYTYTAHLNWGDRPNALCVDVWAVPDAASRSTPGRTNPDAINLGVPYLNGADAIAKENGDRRRAQWCMPSARQTEDRAADQTTDDSSLSDAPPAAIASELTSQGFLPIATRFDPAVYYQNFPRVAGQYDGSYIPFELFGEQTNAAVALINHTRQHNIPLIVVNLPLSQDYLDPVRQTYEQRFQLFLRQLSIAQRFTLVDLNQSELQRNDLFADPSHLNQFGAIAIAEAIAWSGAIDWSAIIHDPSHSP